ncbi:hypothetical protein H6F73_19630 [Microcoleus sp. FACHB-68]|nr:hypothetical protein [Microcoleus sp. FACHB-68]
MKSFKITQLDDLTEGSAGNQIAITLIVTLIDTLRWLQHLNATIFFVGALGKAPVTKVSIYRLLKFG